MKTALTPLDLLDKFFKETPKDEIEKTLNSIKELSIEGPTVDQYFRDFENIFSEYSSEMFHIEELCHSTEIFPQNFFLKDKLIQTVDSVIITVQKDQIQHDKDESIYGLAA